MPFKNLMDYLGRALFGRVPAPVSLGIERPGRPGASRSERSPAGNRWMKAVLDECRPIDFSCHLPGHEVHTATEWAGFKGRKNGQLLDQRIARIPKSGTLSSAEVTSIGSKDTRSNCLVVISFWPFCR